jgi:hypothetical protein
VLSLSDIVNVKVGIGRGVFEAPGATVIGGKKPSFNLEILKLFANGEQGFWYDPSDMGTMFQDAAGTVPVTAVGQAVGLIKDKSGRNNHAYQTTSAARPIFRQKPILGSDIAQGKEWEGSSINNLTEKLADGRYRLTTKSNTSSRMGMLLPLEAGKTYSIELDVETTGFPINILTFTAAFSEVGRVHIATIPANTRTVLKSTFTATDTSFRVGGSMSSNTMDMSFILGSVSVKEVTGYHTDQNYIEYDKVDDKLITNLPAQLTGCTVVRSVPNVGTQILIGQTIPATYEDNKDHCGLIVINRALTPSETSAITAEFNKRAGV